MLNDLISTWEKDFFLYAEINRTKYYQSLWFKEIWNIENIWNTQSIKMELKI